MFILNFYMISIVYAFVPCFFSKSEDDMALLMCLAFESTALQSSSLLTGITREILRLVVFSHFRRETTRKSHLAFNLWAFPTKYCTRDGLAFNYLPFPDENTTREIVLRLYFGRFLRNTTCEMVLRLIFSYPTKVVLVLPFPTKYCTRDRLAFNFWAFPTKNCTRDRLAFNFLPFPTKYYTRDGLAFNCWSFPYEKLHARSSCV